MSKVEALAKEEETKPMRNPPVQPHILPLTILRVLLLCTIYFAYIKADVIQGYIDVLWTWLRHQWWYKAVYFETCLVQVFSFPFIFPYRFLYFNNIATKYRIDKRAGEYELISYRDLAMEVFFYGLPFYALDTFHVKHYATVTDDVINEKRHNWIQRTRALPNEAPPLGEMVRHIVVAFLIFDALFFFQHYAFHKSTTLYRWIHYIHHEDENVNVKTTNKLHLIERVMLVLSANAGLKLQGAHPLTRTMFVFVFVGALYDNHSGYDFPYWYDKILPRGFMGGSRVHYEHHIRGRHYQPFFTYLDKFMEWRREKNMKKS